MGVTEAEYEAGGIAEAGTVATSPGIKMVRRTTILKAALGRGDPKYREQLLMKPPLAVWAD